nr:hypothetical protein [Tanacetum cinerariifolium]
EGEEEKDGEEDEKDEEPEDETNDYDEEFWTPKSKGTSGKSVRTPKSKGTSSKSVPTTKKVAVNNSVPIMNCIIELANKTTWEMIVNKTFEVQKEQVKEQARKGKRKLEVLSERLGIDANSRFMVTYNSDNDIVEEPQSDSANRKIKRLAGKDESSESNYESSESDEEGSESDEDEETTPIENKNYKVDKFWSMPPVLKTPVLDIKKKGTTEESFTELPLYCHSLKVKNPRTITDIETDNQDRFEIFFLQSVLRKLKECIIGKKDNLTIISDGAVSIASDINNVFPNAFHGRCCRHLLMNLREKCPRFISKEEISWKACKAYRISDFEERFSTLRNWLPSVANKLDMIGLEKCKVFTSPTTAEAKGKVLEDGNSNKIEVKEIITCEILCHDLGLVPSMVARSASTTDTILIN